MSDFDIAAWLNSEESAEYREWCEAKEQERKLEMFQDFAGTMVRINDESGKEIGVGTLDEYGIVRGIVADVEYVYQLSRLVIGEE